jgi:subtilisin family serine protease/subtilisin-like proprotein convertase family protein/uncharacterized protein (DUF2141 family)
MESNNLTDDIMKAPADELMGTELVKATPDSAAPNQRDAGEADASDVSSSVQTKQQQLDRISSISSPNNFKPSRASFQSERQLSDTALAAEAEALSPPPTLSETRRSAQEIATPVPDYLQSEEYVPNQIIIKLKPGISASSINSLQQSMNASVIGTTKTLGLHLLQLNGERTVEQTIANFASDSRIAYIEPNYRVSINTTPNDPDFNQLWGLKNSGQTGGTPDADIDAPEAWDIQTGGNVVVGVIDTGVDYTHQDLANNIWTNPGEIAGDGIDNDSNGYVDDIHGYDFVNNDPDPMDDHFHGTHVAGTIAAEGNNGTGVAGVNWKAQIMPLKFLDAYGSGDTFGAIQALEYATMMGAKLTSNSWGGGGYSQALYDAIAAAGDAGQLFVAAAGNSSLDNDTYPDYPSSYDLDNIIAVAATDHNDQLASFSSYGAASVDLGAPGVDIYSTFPGNSYATLSGTSMATPHVSGVAALLWAQNPDMTVSQVKNRILASADPIPALEGHTVSGGRLNAFRSLAEAGKGTIRGSKWEDKDADGVRDPSEPGLPNWKIYLDLNNNGVLDEQVTNYSSTDVPMPIIDEETVTSELTLSDFSGTVTDVNVTLDINHTWDKDLDVFLVSPSGTEIELFTDVGADGDNFTNTTLDDEAATPITEGFAPFTGSFQPEGSLAVLDGEDPNGTWTLKITDDAKLDAGILNSWSLSFTEAIEPLTQTDASGDYAFNGLEPGTYTVAEVPQPGWEQTYPGGDGSQMIAVGADEIVEDVDFGNRNTDFGVIKGTKFSDLNGDALRNEGEPGLSGWTIYLDADGDGTLDPEETSTTTDADGDYSFVDLPAGTYTVAEVLQEGWEQTYPGDPGTHTVNIEPGDVVTGMDFGNDPLPAEIAGIKWNDLNGDGVQDPNEPVMPGWKIYLDANGNGTLDGGETSTLTGASGEYKFANLNPGTYTVAEEVPAGWVQTYPGNPPNGSFETGDFTSWDTAGNSSMETAAFGVGPTDGTYQALLTNGYGSMSDADLETFLGLSQGSLDGLGNGDATEGSAIKQTIAVQAGDTLTFDWDFLTNEGMSSYFNDFAFVSVAPETSSTLASTYSPLVTSPNPSFFQHTGFDSFSYTFTTGGTYTIGVGVVDVGDTVVDSGLLVDNFSLDSSLPGAHIVTLDPGDSLGGVNFGNWVTPGEIRGSKWEDADGNGVRDVGEVGLSGWTIYLDADGDGTFDADETSTTTDANGDYSFADLPPGTYTVAEVQQEGWEQTYPGSPGTHTVNLESGEIVTGMDFGNDPLPGEIHGIKWNDVNGDGVQNPDESGLAGWTIYLDANQNGNLDDGEVSAVTGDSGEYSFTDLDAGSYTVAEVPQNGWVQTYPGDVGSVLNEPNDTILEAIPSWLNSSNPQTFNDTGAIGDNPNVTPASDVDLIELQLNAGDLVTIDIDTNEFGSSLDSVLRLFDSTGTQVAVSDDAPAPGEWFSLDSYINFTAPSSDTYYVGVSSFANFNYDPFVEGSGSGYSTGNYDIEIAVNGGGDSPFAYAHIVNIDPGDTVTGIDFGNQQIAPPPALSVDDLSVTEGDTGTVSAVFTVSLSAASTETVTVGYATADGTATAGEDYTATAGTLTFDPGETAQTISVPVFGDTLDEFDETFSVNLIDPMGATIADSEGVGTILDDDAAGGTPGHDWLIGTPGHDTLDGGEGHDTIEGLEGYDSLIGGSGHDSLLGGAGYDTLDGGTGHDFLDGGADHDILNGGEDHDTLNGGTGKDTLTGGKGDDSLFGGDGKDLLIGVEPDDALPGFEELDTLAGGAGADRFVLGDAVKGAYYNDGVPSSTGTEDFALLADFSTSEDFIQLAGVAANYVLYVVGSDTEIYREEGATDELIGRVAGVTGLTLTGSYFVYV